VLKEHQAGLPVAGIRRGCAKTRREIPYGRAQREFSRFFPLCEAISLEIWSRPWPPKSFRTASAGSSWISDAVRRNGGLGPPGG
jgi:hypothetical protein